MMIFDPNERDEDVMSPEEADVVATSDGTDDDAGALAATPAAEIVKAVKKARKSGKKKAAKKPAKKKGKTAPRGKASRKGLRKVTPRPSKSTGKSSNGSKRGPKGNPPEKVFRKGDAAYGKRVAAARHAKGLTGRALAEKLGVTQPAICNIERGTLAAGIPMQKALKKTLGVEMTKACQAAIDAGKTHIIIRERKPRAKKSKK